MEVLHERPAKIIRCELFKCDIETLDAQDLCRIRKNIHASRCSTVPTLPKTLDETHNILKNYNLMTNRGENFLFINSAETNIIGFSCDSNLKVLREMKTVFIDGTFKSCPKLFYQLFTVHGVKNNHYVPLVFFLLPNKTSDTYTKAFRLIQNYLSPDKIYADFERAIHVAISEVWPLAQLKGCRFHLGQAWWRKIQQLGLPKEFKIRIPK
ncbi:uncharacterized protein LOC112592439 [Melanaphis sacchari]|uniref:uncharacterized protein LOC112592439 n=1 Tax=Melanaphis sacchari TaxID=742174 RepID=UPI000DC14232|nr:uncharacterized protein LOC112592439 [Melanaphis sacchari]